MPSEPPALEEPVAPSEPSAAEAPAVSESFPEPSAMDEPPVLEDAAPPLEDAPPPVEPVVAAEEVPPPPPPLPDTIPFPPEPAATVPPVPRLTISPKVVPHIRAVPTEPPPGEAEVPPMHRRSFKIGVLIAVAGVALLLIVGALVVWKMLGSDSSAPVVADNPPAPVEKPAASAKTPEGPTPSATLNEVAAMPKKTIDHAKSVIDQRTAQEESRAEEAFALENPTVPQPSAPAPSTAAQPAKPETVQPAPAPAPSAPPPPAPVVVPKASNAFKAFVSEAKISGVFQGTPPRALINGRTVRAGELVNKELGVSFESIDVSTKTITFVDEAGARVSRRY
jgi:hypothetical protein